MFLKNKNKLFGITLLSILLILSFYIPQAYAMSNLNFGSSGGSYNVGDTINIKVIVSSDTSINAVSGKISFSNDVLSLVSISKNNSIINLWAQEPSYSNSSGTVSFEGVILNGYIGSGGIILSMNFKAKAVGKANLNFIEGSILANDGNGTEIISSKGQSIVNINAANVTPKAPSLDKKNKDLVKPIELDKNNIKEIETNKYEDNNMISYDLLIIILLVLTVLLIFIIVIYYIDRVKKSVKRKLVNIESSISKDFMSLEKSLEKEQTSYFKLKKNKTLTEEEIDSMNAVEKEIEDTEKDVLKEIRKIEQDI